MLPFPNYDRSETFRESDAAMLVVDTDLVIRDVNAAYLEIAFRRREDLMHLPIFKVFPANPNDPDGAAREEQVRDSFEQVIRTGRRQRTPVSRHDVPAAAAPGGFVRRFWTSVNSPIRDTPRHVIGVLQHVEDVTVVIESISHPLPALPPTLDDSDWANLLHAFAHEHAGHQEAAVTARQLQDALDSRIMIEQAKGLVAGREHISLGEAFLRLRGYSNNQHIPIQQVASAVVRGHISV